MISIWDEFSCDSQFIQNRAALVAQTYLYFWDMLKNICISLHGYLKIDSIHLSFSHVADAFIQSDLQMRTIEAIKTNKKQQHASADKSG